MSVRVGSRRSRLARVQTEQLLASLRALDPSFAWEPVLVETTGDVILDVPLREAGGKGLFVKELDEALLDGRVDCAVHSLKDIPTELPEGIRIACVPARADPRDVLLSRDGVGLDSLLPGWAPTVAASSSVSITAMTTCPTPVSSLRCGTNIQIISLPS